MRETGTVISVDRGTARVQFVPKEACEQCSAKSFCHPEPHRMVADAVNELGAQVGDLVTMETEARASVLAAALVFLAPIGALVVGYLLGRTYRGTETGGVIGGVFTLILSIAVLGYVDRRVLRPRRFMPRITSVTREGVNPMAKDVVCGMEVSEDTAHKTEHSGRTYYFCCEACKVSFEKNPDEYTKD